MLGRARRLPFRVRDALHRASTPLVRVLLVYGIRKRTGRFDRRWNHHERDFNLAAFHQRQRAC